MNVIHFSPHFPDNYYQFSAGLKKAGATVLGIGDAPYEQLSAELKRALTEYYRIDDMEDYDKVLRAAGYFTHRYGKIDRIDSLNDHWLDLEAQLRTDFNIFGLNNSSIDILTKKSRMKERFIKAGVAVAEGRIITNIAEANEFIKKVGYPVVVKPDRGVGAINTFKLAKDKELEFFFAGKQDTPYIMEEFVAGDILSFDGLTDRSGNIVFYTGHSYMSGIMETVNDDNNIYYYSFRELPEDLETAGLNTVKAFDIRERFFHIEYFRRAKDKKLVALEINARPPGGYTTDMFNYANDMDIYQEWANVVVLNKFSSSYSRKYHCCYIGRKLNKRYQFAHEEVVSRLGALLVHHTPVSGVFRAALGDYGYLIRSGSLDEIHKAIEYIHLIREKGT